MLPELRDQVLEWLSKARADFEVAQLLRTSTPRHWGIACFLCQQAAEKMLKAYLVWRQTPFRWSHDLGYLVGLCTETEPEFQELRVAARTLTPYATGFRYPPRRSDPSSDETHTAIRLAEAVMTFVLERLPEQVRHSDSAGSQGRS